MKYTISYHEPHKHFIDIELFIEDIDQDFIELQLPAWRPGRYELSNFAKNIQRFEVFNEKGNSIKFKKTSRERWKIETQGSRKISVKYNYYAAQMDAGGCWLDEEQLYINFIGCMMYIPEREHKPCSVKIEIPKDYRIACGLSKKGNTLFATDFYHLVDSPMIASKSLLHKSFKTEKAHFNIWILGEVNPDWQMILADFKKFTEEQIKVFGEFPEEDYHFLYQILPYKHYHGVEHRNSTVITLGPSEIFNTKGMYNTFLGISSHELFHAWNIIKIRPAEMMPYDLSKENYFRTGFVAEGVTTYYGDLMLVRSGVIDVELYFNELNTLFKKHFENFGRFNLSLADSSFDLWVDGYVQGIPNRKISIYGKGAVVALLLDLEIRVATSHKKSLDDVMKLMYLEFGKKKRGYTIKDYQHIIEKIAETSFKDYFENCIEGVLPIEKRISEALHAFGCELEIIPSPMATERIFGFNTCQKDGKTCIDNIEPHSPADLSLTKDDEIIAVDSFKVSGNIQELLSIRKKATITYFRKHKLHITILQSDKKNFFKQYRIVKKKDATEVEKSNFKKWVKVGF
jgi:predicted metalloprotease with PDZ domain